MYQKGDCNYPLQPGLLSDVIYASTRYTIIMTKEQVKSRKMTVEDTPRVIDFDALRATHKRHLRQLKKIQDRKEPRSGELADVSLEEEFEN